MFMDSMATYPWNTHSCLSDIELMVLYQVPTEPFIHVKQNTARHCQLAFFAVIFVYMSKSFSRRSVSFRKRRPM